MSGGEAEGETETDNSVESFGTIGSYSSGTDWSGSDASLCPSEPIPDPGIFSEDQKADIEIENDNRSEIAKLWTELSSYREELRILKNKIAEDEAWKKILDYFILSRFGYDIRWVLLQQLAEFDVNSKSDAHVSSSEIQNVSSNPKTEAETENGMNLITAKQCKSPLVKIRTTSTSSSGTEFRSTSRKKRKWIQSDGHDDNDDNSNSNAASTSIEIKAEPDQDLPGSSKVARYSPSVLYNNEDSSSMQNNCSPKNKDNDNDSWSVPSIPTFPLSDAGIEAVSVTEMRSFLKPIPQSHSNLVTTNEDVPLFKTEFQDFDEPNTNINQFRENASMLMSASSSTSTDVTFHDVEDQICELIPPGKQSKVYQCRICFKSLTQKQNARLHVRRVHFGERLKCFECGRNFYDRRSIANHKSTCTQSKSQSTCDTKFDGDSNSVTHTNLISSFSGGTLKGVPLTVPKSSSSNLSAYAANTTNDHDGDENTLMLKSSSIKTRVRTTSSSSANKTPVSTASSCSNSSDGLVICEMNLGLKFESTGKDCVPLTRQRKRSFIKSHQDSLSNSETNRNQNKESGFRSRSIDNDQEKHQCNENYYGQDQGQGREGDGREEQTDADSEVFFSPDKLLKIEMATDTSSSTSGVSDQLPVSK